MRFLLIAILLFAGCCKRRHIITPVEKECPREEIDLSRPDGSLLFKFPDELTRNAFEEALSEAIPAHLHLSIFGNDSNIYSVRYIEQEGIFTLNDSLNGSEFFEFTPKLPHIESHQVISFDSISNLHLKSSFPVESPLFSPLTIESGEELFSLSQQGNTTTIKLYPETLGSLSSIDLAELWNDFLLRNPALGRAILGNVRGLRESIEGRSNRIRGIRPLTINTLSVETTDGVPISPEAINHLPGIAGRYRKSVDGSTGRFIPTPKTREGDIPYINEISITFDKRLDPVISLSTAKSDGVVFFMDENHDALKRRLSDGTVTTLDEALLFLALGPHLTSDIRSLISENIYREDIISHLGTSATPIETLSGREIPKTFGTNIHQPLSQPLKMIYPNDNPLAEALAGTLSLLLQKRGIPIEIAQGYSYEKNLYQRDYDIAIGFTTRSFLNQPYNNTIISNYWFTGEVSEQMRIVRGEQISLLSIPIYIASRKELDFSCSTIESIFIPLNR